MDGGLRGALVDGGLVQLRLRGGRLIEQRSCGWGAAHLSLCSRSLCSTVGGKWGCASGCSDEIAVLCPIYSPSILSNANGSLGQSKRDDACCLSFISIANQYTDYLLNNGNCFRQQLKKKQNFPLCKCCFSPTCFLVCTPYL